MFSWCHEKSVILKLLLLHTYHQNPQIEDKSLLALWMDIVKIRGSVIHFINFYIVQSVLFLRGQRIQLLISGWSFKCWSNLWTWQVSLFSQNPAFLSNWFLKTNVNESICQRESAIKMFRHDLLSHFSSYTIAVFLILLIMLISYLVSMMLISHLCLWNIFLILCLKFLVDKTKITGKTNGANVDWNRNVAR